MFLFGNSNALRLSIEWSRVFPVSTIGVPDLRSVASPAALAYYHAVFAAMKAPERALHRSGAGRVSLALRQSHQSAGSDAALSGSVALHDLQSIHSAGAGRRPGHRRGARYWTLMDIRVEPRHDHAARA